MSWARHREDKPVIDHSGDPVRRVICIELDSTRRWSSSELEAELMEKLPERRPIVFGEVSGSEVDAAYRKLRQLCQETERQDTLANRLHSAQKALSFFQDMWPTRLWKWWLVGASQDERQKLLRD